MQIIERDKDGSYFRYDLDHAYKVWKARRDSKNFPNPSEQRNENLINHELVGRKIKHIPTGNVYVIEKVHKQWYAGWSISILVQRNGSHKSIFWENINSFHEITLNQIKEAKESYELIVKCGNDGTKWSRDACEYDEQGVCIHCKEGIPF